LKTHLLKDLTIEEGTRRLSLAETWMENLDEQLVAYEK